MRLVCLALAAAALTGCAATPERTSAASTRARVIRVVDGDTLKVRVGSVRESVRLLGIDTPESVKPGAPPQCGGRAASRNLGRMVLTPDGRGRTVRLIGDPTQARRDRYDRLLAYVELLSGRDVGRAQIADGWARVFVYRGIRFERVDAYRAAERSAKRSGRGIWSRCPA